MRRLALVVALLLGLTACHRGADRPARAESGSVRPAPVYVAVGGDETRGSMLGDKLRDAWPQLFYRDALPGDAVFYNLAREGGLTAASIPGVLDLVDELAPSLTTLWWDSTDEQQIVNVIRRLRRNGATRVLVAATNDVVSRVAAAKVPRSSRWERSPCRRSRPRTIAQLRLRSPMRSSERLDDGSSTLDRPLGPVDVGRYARCAGGVGQWQTGRLLICASGVRSSPPPPDGCAHPAG